LIAGKIDIFNGREYTHVSTLKGGHLSPVSQIDWEAGATGMLSRLRSNSYGEPFEVMLRPKPST